MSMYDREWYREMYQKADTQHPAAEPSATGNHSLRNRIIPTLCPLCGYYFHVQVKGGFGNTLKYKCPQCGKKVWIRVEHITDKIVNIILGSLGLCSLVYLLFISWPSLSDYLRMVLQQYLP